ncbi:uncharacterized protein O3C94_009997 [Discoglossus pictus]
MNSFDLHSRVNKTNNSSAVYKGIKDYLPDKRSGGWQRSESQHLDAVRKAYNQHKCSISAFLKRKDKLTRSVTVSRLVDIQDVVKFVREHQLQSIKPDLWTPKVIYKLLRSKDIMESVDGLPAKTAETVWDNVSSKRLTNRHKDTAWMAIQGGLPLRQFMHARGLCRYRHCPRGCTAEETSLHVFWQCPFAQNLLDSLADELKDCIPRRYLTYHSVLYGLFHCTHSVGAIQDAWRIMCCVKDALWFARNRLILKRITVTTQDCRRLVLSLLRDYSILDSPEEEA